jgi:hypothetical protein
MKQTAVEWLQEQFKKHELIFDPEIKNFEQHLFNKALEMEKLQSEKLKNSILELYDMVHNSNSTQDKIRANEIFSEIFKNNL